VRDGNNFLNILKNDFNVLLMKFQNQQFAKAAQKEKPSAGTIPAPAAADANIKSAAVHDDADQSF
jgi:hypothetical protein